MVRVDQLPGPGGGCNVFTFSSEVGGGVRQNLGNESISQPPSPHTHTPDTEKMRDPL